VAIVCALLQLYLVVLFARIIVSWFPVTPGTGFAQVVDVLRRLTDPILQPVRRIIPPVGMFDLSTLVVLLVFQVVVAKICPGSSFI
jgi:YggT family protein